MKVSPKIVGTSVVLGSSGTGSGYAIKKATIKKVKKEYPTKFKRGTIGHKLRRLHFEVLPKEGKDNEGKVLEEANKTDSTKTHRLYLQAECKYLLLEAYNPDDLNDFKEAAKQCTKKQTFRERLSKLKLDLLTEADVSELNTNGRGDAIKANEFANELKTEPYNITDTLTTYSADLAKKLINKCGNYSNNNSQHSENVEEKWKRYLHMCAKNKDDVTYASVKDKNYGTNK